MKKQWQFFFLKWVYIIFWWWSKCCDLIWWMRCLEEWGEKKRSFSELQKKSFYFNFNCGINWCLILNIVQFLGCYYIYILLYNFFLFEVSFQQCWHFCACYDLMTSEICDIRYDLTWLNNVWYFRCCVMFMFSCTYLHCPQLKFFLFFVKCLMLKF